MSISESAYRPSWLLPFSGNNIIFVNLMPNIPMLLPKRFISHLVGTAVFTLFLATGHAQQASKKLNIAVIPKGTTHVFWKSVEAGARQAAQELGQWT